MKTLFSIAIILVGYGTFGQNTVYDSLGKKKSVIIQEESLHLSPLGIDTIHMKSGDENVRLKMIPPAVIIAIAKEIFSVAYNISISGMEGRIKKFAAEYEREKSYLNAGDRSIPNITYQQKVQFEDGNTLENALTVVLKAKKIEGDLNYFYYYIDSINLDFSKAKTVKKSARLDYSIVIQTTFLVDTTVITITSAPIQIHSVDFVAKDYDSTQYISDLIPIPENAFFLKAGIKIVETNPQKVNAQRLLDFWKKTEEENGDSVEELLNLIFVDKADE